MPLLLQFPITLLQFPIALKLLNRFGSNYEEYYTCTYTLYCFWIASVVISARRVLKHMRAISCCPKSAETPIPIVHFDKPCFLANLEQIITIEKGQAWTR